MPEKWTTNRVIWDLRKGETIRCTEHRRTGTAIWYRTRDLRPIPHEVMMKLQTKGIVRLDLQAVAHLDGVWAQPLPGPRR